MGRYLIGVVIPGVVEVMTHSRGEHSQQVNIVYLTLQVSHPDQPIHLQKETMMQNLNQINVCG